MTDELVVAKLDLNREDIENWLAVETAEDLRKLVIGWGIPDWLLDGDLAFLTEEELNSLNVQVNIRLDQ